MNEGLASNYNVELSFVSFNDTYDLITIIIMYN